MELPKIHCNDILYRAGFIEVCPDIHPGHINIEIWNLDPGYDQQATDITDSRISDADVTGNTEIELSIAQARELVRQLTLAIEAAS